MRDKAGVALQAKAHTIQACSNVPCNMNCSSRRTAGLAALPERGGKDWGGGGVAFCTQLFVVTDVLHKASRHIACDCWLTF